MRKALSSETLVPDALESAKTLVEAVKRVGVMALVDTSLALPRAKPICDVALKAVSITPSNGAEFMLYRPSSRPSALLVLCHPSGGPSLCHSLADMWEEGLKDVGVDCKRVDLSGTHANLSLGSAAELEAARAGRNPECVPDEVQRLQALVEECQFLIFVHPIFWFEVPAQLKGFLESVLSSGFAFRKLPSHWVLNKAAGVIEHVPVARSYMRRYAAYGLLRDKSVFVTRTQGGPEAGMGIFGHGATSLESSVQFCGASVAAVDVVAEIDSTEKTMLRDEVLPRMHLKIKMHCRKIAEMALAWPAKEEPETPAEFRSDIIMGC